MGIRVVHSGVDELSTLKRALGTNGERGTAPEALAASVLLERPRILLVDDYAPWRRTVRSILQDHAELQFVGEVADGMEAVQKARELKPDLMLLDVGLPHLNGIEAAKRIRQVAPDVTILFLSMNNQVDLVLAALSTGAKGYVLQKDAGSELWPAIEAVLQGQQYVSRGVAASTGVGRSLVLAN